MGRWTIDRESPKAHAKIIRYGRLISDIFNRPFSALRVLDLAYLETEYTIKLARQGAGVDSFERRDGNIDQTRLLRQALGLNSPRPEQDDVRNFSVRKHGRFDAAPCAGIRAIFLK